MRKFFVDWFDDFRNERTPVAQDVIYCLERTCFRRRQSYFELVLAVQDVVKSIVQRVGPDFAKLDEELCCFNKADKWLSCVFANLDEACSPLMSGARDVIEVMLHDNNTVLEPDDVFKLKIHDMCQRVWKVCGFPKMTGLGNYFEDLIDSFRATGSPIMPTSMHFWFTLMEDTCGDAFMMTATARAEAYYTQRRLDLLELEQSLANDDMLVFLVGSERHALYMSCVRVAIATHFPAYASQILAMLKNGQSVSTFIEIVSLATADAKEAFASQLENVVRALPLPTDNAIKFGLAALEVLVLYIRPFNRTDLSASMQRGFNAMLNRHAECVTLVAQALDALLKQQCPTLFEVVEVALYLDDRDAFIESTYALMARRLQQALFARPSTSSEAVRVLSETETQMQLEKRMLSVLSQKFGNCRCLAQLLEDATTVDTQIVTRFCNVLANMSMSINVCVMRSFVWPSKPMPSLVLPTWMYEVMDAHTQLYHCMTERRKLTWHYDDTFEIETTRTPQTHTLRVSLLQMCILMQFNDSVPKKFKDICSSIGGDPAAVKRALDDFVSNNILQVDRRVYSANDKYVGCGSTVDLKTEIEPTQHVKSSARPVELDDKERLYALQAAVVRHLKLHKQCARSSLGDVLTLTFKPTLKQLNRVVDILVDKEYIQLQDDNARGVRDVEGGRSLVSAETLVH